MKPISNIKNLLVNELKHCYHSEKRQIKAYPKLIKNSKSSRVKKTIEMIMKRKEENVKSLERVFYLLSEDPNETNFLYKSTKDLLAEIFYLLKNSNKQLSDSIIISHLRQINNFDRERYKTAINYSMQLNLSKISEIIHSLIINQKSSDPFHMQIETETLRRSATR